jgi:hypothetical protein
MSYDLYVLSVEPGETAVEAFPRITEADEQDATTTWHHEQAARAERLAGSLQRLNLRLERFAFDYAELAKSLKISESEARARFQHIELNTREGDNPIQIVLHADHAFLNIPYWCKGPRAQETINEALRYLAILEAEAGWTTYDPQLERSLNTSTDLEAVVTMYGVGSRHVEELARGAATPPQDQPAKKKKRFGLF